MTKYHFVYETKNKINGKKYIGKHSTSNVFDGYYGSGDLIIRAIKKYGKENFEFKIIKLFDTSDEAYAYEAYIVDEYVTESPHYYNIDLGGIGCNRANTEESNLKRSNTMKGKPKPPRTEEHKRNHALAMAKRKLPEKPKKIRTYIKGEAHPLHGRTRPKSVTDKMSKALRKSILWENENELFDLWISNNKPGWRKMRPLAISHGFPDVDYYYMIKVFRKAHNE